MGSEDSFYLEQTYGTDRHLPRENLIQYGKAIMLIVGADGTISDAEMACWMGIAKAMGVSDDVREEWRKFDWRHSRLEDCIPGLSTDPQNPGELTLAFLYDAIRISRADGVYGAAEKAAVAKAARALGIPQSSVNALESLVELEQSVRTLRLSLLYPTIPPLRVGEQHPRYR
jgi:uncharacterized tellurite resistance protein B-like protein